MRLTDMLYFNRNLFNEGVTQRELFTQLPVSKHHFLQCITEHVSAIFEIAALGHDFRSLHKLAHVTRTYLGVFGCVADHYKPLRFFI